LTRDELAAALGCDPSQVEACAAALPRAAYMRLVSRAIAAREVIEPPEGQGSRFEPSSIAGDQDPDMVR
jgi:hypothetical protein